jgi:hypothetical protein
MSSICSGNLRNPIDENDAPHLTSVFSVRADEIAEVAQRVVKYVEYMAGM